MNRTNQSRGIDSSRPDFWDTRFTAEKMPWDCLGVLHLPDYDPVGFTEFLRYHERLGEADTLFIPDDLPSLFRRHSNLSLLADVKNQRMLMKLRKARHTSVRQVVALIDECNGGIGA